MYELKWSESYQFNNGNYHEKLKEPFFKSKGVYIWAYEVAGKYYVHYIGKTHRSFTERCTEHFKAAVNGTSYMYELVDEKDPSVEIKRIACKGAFVDKNKENYLEKKYLSLQNAGKNYISNLHFFFCALADNEIIDGAESFLINDIISNKSLSYTSFFINEAVPEKTEYEYINVFSKGVSVIFDNK